MSTKKNLIFNVILETTPLVKSIILDQIISYEHNQCQKELEELRELVRQKEEALALASLEVSQQKSESDKIQENSQTPELENAQLGDTITDNNNTPTSEQLVDFQEVSPNPLLEMELPSEDSIIEKYRLKINTLYKYDFKQLRDLYKFLFENFNYWENGLKLIEERSLGDELFTEKYLNTGVGRFSLYNYTERNVNSEILKDPLWILFLLRLEPTSVKIFHKLLKLKVRKWKLKKRKLRKIRSLRKIRRIAFFKKSKRRFFLTKWNMSYFYGLNDKSLPKILTKRIPLSNRVIDASNVEFFYKLNKDINLEFEDYINLSFDSIEDDDDDFLLYLRNYHQKPYWKLRNSRISHWKLFYNKTIRQQRYKGFINKYVKNYNKLSYPYTYLVNFFTQFNLSWSRTDKLESLLKRSLIEVTKQKIVKLPIFFQNLFKWKVLKRKNYYLRKKVGKWSFLNFRRATCPWLQRKKNSPKTALHLQPKLFHLSANSHWDSMTGYLYLNDKLLKHTLPVRDEFKTNLLIKLHMYRYKANRQCMSHLIII